MTNSYPYIQILQDGTPKHLGGGEQSILYFDPVFFQGKYILLFDDVITKGDSMEKYRRKLEPLGVIVVGGLFIGKTRHERLEDNPDPIATINDA